MQKCMSVISADIVVMLQIKSTLQHPFQAASALISSQLTKQPSSGAPAHENGSPAHQAASTETAGQAGVTRGKSDPDSLLTRFSTFNPRQLAQNDSGTFAKPCIDDLTTSPTQKANSFSVMQQQSNNSHQLTLHDHSAEYDTPRQQSANTPRVLHLESAKGNRGGDLTAQVSSIFGSPSSNSSGPATAEDSSGPATAEATTAATAEAMTEATAEAIAEAGHAAPVEATADTNPEAPADAQPEAPPEEQDMTCISSSKSTPDMQPKHCMAGEQLEMPATDATSRPALIATDATSADAVTMPSCSRLFKPLATHKVVPCSETVQTDALQPSSDCSREHAMSARRSRMPTAIALQSAEALPSSDCSKAVVSAEHSPLLDDNAHSVLVTESQPVMGPADEDAESLPARDPVASGDEVVCPRSGHNQRQQESHEQIARSVMSQGKLCMTVDLTDRSGDLLA